MRFQNRQQAGHLLAQKIKELNLRKPLTVFGLARGGVPVAAVIAQELKAPLEALVVRKVGYPGNEEFAIGAVTARVRYLDSTYRDMMGTELDERIKAKQREAEDLEAEFGAATTIAGTAILVDDGAATGATMQVAINDVQSRGAQRVIVALPVASDLALAMCTQRANDVICLHAPSNLTSVSLYYQDFSQVETETVKRILKESTK